MRESLSMPRGTPSATILRALVNGVEAVVHRSCRVCPFVLTLNNETERCSIEVTYPTAAHPALNESQSHHSSLLESA